MVIKISSCISTFNSIISSILLVKKKLKTKSIQFKKYKSNTYITFTAIKNLCFTFEGMF